MTITADSLLQNIADFRSQMLRSLTNTGSDEGSSFDSILAKSKAQSGNASSLSPSGSGSGSGENSIADLLASGGQGAGYAMMTLFNRLDVTYKAQYSELSQIDAELPQLEGVAEQLGAVAGRDGINEVKATLQSFADEYNAWVQRFGPDVAEGGVLDGTQAAELSLYELNQAITSPFLGAKDGFGGLADLGITVDASTGLMSVDSAKFDAAWANNQQGVTDTLDEFSASFAKAADLLASDGNLVQNRLDNLMGAITFLKGNMTSLHSEFGSGDPAKPTGQVAKALAAYNSSAGV